MFELDPKLKNDTYYLKTLNLCELLLMNDKRYIWFILVPKREKIIEIYELDKQDQVQLWNEITEISEWAKHEFSGDKINIGALGNVVSQLHVHIIVRKITDENWPKAIWGEGTPKPYTEIEYKKILEKIP